MPFVELNGLETYYEEYGEGHPVVVLHGAGVDHQVWAEQLRPLADQCRVLLYDLRGHGRTETAATETFTMDQYVDDLGAFLDELDLDSPTVLGHSFGGMIGYRFAADSPDRLSGLVTVGSATPEMFSTGEWFARSAMPRVVAPVSSNEWVMNALHWLGEKLFVADSAADEDEFEEIRAAHTCDAAADSDPDLPKINRALQTYLQSELDPSSIEVELLVLYGENEAFLERHADHFEAQLEDCETAAVPDGSHMGHVDDPGFVQDKLRAFVTDASRGPDSSE
ncbi:alpha/beta fold hydrolase [Halorubellus salinus]|uniref:alpha/beta fold hydrolase n=1 Tax=Halorubellus salinus TaxID=755309 RepID=UPI001D0941F6|nr:alpha/beta hydrolase [Halorubellus salinus]